MAVDVSIAAVNERHQPLANVIIEAYDADTHEVIQRATTDKAGYAVFTGLPTDQRIIYKPQITRAGGGLHSVGNMLEAGTGVELETSTGGVITIIVTGAGIDHGLLSGLSDDDHTQYRLESENHTHQSSGLQGGTLDHGLALTGLTDDDHTIYLKEKASGGTAAEVPTHAHSGAAEAGTISHADLTSVSANQHHNENHASRHSDGGADEVNLEDLATAETDVALVPHPDGAGGVVWGTDSGGGGGGNGVTTIVSAADEEETSTTLQDHNELSLSLDAASTYYFRFVLKCLNDGAAEGIKVAVNGTAGVGDLKAQVYIWDDTLNTLAGFARTTAFDSTVGAGLSSGVNEVIIEGSILTTTAGTFKLRFAQNASGASAGVHIQPGSSLVICSDAVTTLAGATDALFAVFADHTVLTNEVNISAKKFVMFGADSDFSAEINMYTLGAINEIKGWPPQVLNDLDLVTQNLWFDAVGTPTTQATFVDIAGEASLDALAIAPFKSLYALKCITDAANEGWAQRWTYADEPRLASGFVMSCIVAIATTSGASGITVKLVNSDATSTTGTSLLSSGDWDIFIVENHTLAGTYCDLQVTKDASGTFYAVPFSANVGPRALFLKPRGLNYVWKDAPTSVKTLTGLGDEATWTDVDCTSATHNLCVMVQLRGRLAENTATDDFLLYTRRNGTSTAAGEGLWAGRVGGTTFTGGGHEIMDFIIILDDQQIFEYFFDRNAGSGTLLFGDFQVAAYWMWE